MCDTIASVVLIATNVGVILIGLALTIIGALLEWGQDIMAKYLSSALSSLGSAAGLPEVTLNSISVLIGEYMKYLNAAGLVIFIVGLVLFFIGICGACGACRKSKVLLIIYITFVAIILIGMIVLTCLIAFKKDDVRTQGEILFKDYIKNTFVGLAAGANAESAILSLVMARLGCCGVTNSSDFDPASAPKWNNTYKFENGTTIALKIPLTCCKMKTAGYTPEYESCLTDPNTTNSNMDTGCYTLLWNLIDAYSNYTMYALIALCVLLFLLIVCAVTVIQSAAKDTAV